MKKILIALLAVLMILSLSSCNNENGVPSYKATLGEWGDDRVSGVNAAKKVNEDGSITLFTIERETSGANRWQGIVSYVDMAEEGVTSWSVSTTVKLPAEPAAGMNSGIWIDCDPTEITRTDAIIAAVYDETAEGLVWKVYDEEPNNGGDWVDIEG